MGEEFLKTVKALKSSENAEYALGYVQGCTEKSMEIFTLKQRVKELEIENALYKPAIPTITPTAQIQADFAKHREHVAEGKLPSQPSSPPIKHYSTRGKTNLTILNELKKSSNLSLKDFLALTGLNAKMIYAALARLEKNGSIISCLKPGAKRAKLWSLPVKDRIGYQIITGVSH